MHEYPSSLKRHVRLGWYPYRIWYVNCDLQTCGECLNYLHYIHHTGISILTSWLPNSPISLVISWSSWPLIPSIIQYSHLMTIRSGVSLKSTMMTHIVRSRPSLQSWKRFCSGFRPDHRLITGLVQHPLVNHILILLNCCHFHYRGNYTRLFGRHKLHFFRDIHSWTTFFVIS